MPTVIVLVAVILFFAYLSNIQGLWGNSKASKKATKDMQSVRKFMKKQERTAKLMGVLAWFAKNYGVTPNKYKLDSYYFLIERLKIRINILNRTIKPIEFIGIIKLLSLAVVFTGLCVFIVTGSPLALVSLLGFMLEGVVLQVLKSTIRDRDRQLEEDFPLFYMMIYPRLLKGTEGRISVILVEYLDITSTAKARKDKKIIREYVEDLKMKVELYNDDVTALLKTREIYGSAMIVNFTNLAVQALRGVDNSDRLVTFKIELQNKENELMEKRAKKIIGKAEKAVWAIFIILLQVIIVTYASRLTIF